MGGWTSLEAWGAGLFSRWGLWGGPQGRLLWGAALGCPDALGLPDEGSRLVFSYWGVAGLGSSQWELLWGADLPLLGALGTPYEGGGPASHPGDPFVQRGVWAAFILTLRVLGYLFQQGVVGQHLPA